MYVQGKVMRLCVGLVSGLLLVACTKQWFLSVSVDGQAVVLCVSRVPACGGDGAQLESLELAEVSPDGERGRVMWSLQARPRKPTDGILKRVVYGQTPAGWTERSPALPLTKGVYYVVNDLHYFRFADSGPIEVIEREQFFQKKR